MFVYSLVPLSPSPSCCSFAVVVAADFVYSYFTFCTVTQLLHLSKQTSDKQLVDITICMSNERI